MFIAIVQIPMTKRPRDAAVDSARKSAPTYTALGAKGLLKKYYLNGESGGGGVYLWESEAAASSRLRMETGRSTAIVSPIIRSGLEIRFTILRRKPVRRNASFIASRRTAHPLPSA